MTDHLKPQSVELIAALKRHHLSIYTPSQLSDAFRAGWNAAESQYKKPSHEQHTVQRVKPLAWEQTDKFSIWGSGFGGYRTCIYCREDGKFKITLYGIGVTRPSLVMAKELLENEYQEYIAPAFYSTDKI